MPYTNALTRYIANDDSRPAADRFENADLIGLLRDEIGDGVEDQDRADHHADKSQ